ncbi:MAG: hypothetical protein BWX88_00530 [Planctomycetes bacterium ADurb.Bin126]|nr:MAG: hypothetical protein BWX88_00530 [Planctomycetes bacterium ADurb.Bin126]
MNRNRLTRRNLLNTAAATAGALVLGGRPGGQVRAADADAVGRVASTPHFSYRFQPASLYIDSQRDDKAFAFTAEDVRLSEDCGHTWAHRAAFADAQKVTFSHIFKNGNLLFATQNRLFLSTDNLKTIAPVTVKDVTGADYLPHTPKNPNCPGWYFHTLSGVCSWEIDGREMLVWGNYCSVVEGATPVNIYYSTDNGRTVKIAYSFGQNPFHRDDGTGGGGPKGVPLGDPNNPVFCRHIHCVAYNPAERAFYACTGDHDRKEGLECHWLRGTYDAQAEKWNWKVIVSEHLNSRYKAGGINFVDGKLYWISDANGPKPHDRGVFRSKPEDIADRTRHEMLYNPKYECGMMIIRDKLILATHLAPASPFSTGVIISTDLGKTWAEYDIKEFGRRSPTRIHPPNSEGWYRMDIRTGWVTRADVLFIKPK